MSAFFELHKDLPREGPGDRTSLDWAIGHIDLPENGAVLDAACGPGADIADLMTHVPQGHVTAFDGHAPFVKHAAERHASDPRVTVVEADMKMPPGGPYDLIWCAGALYFLGVREGLSAWRSVLKPGGYVIFSEPQFFTDTPSDGAVAFWEGHPTGTRAEILTQIEAAGFDLISDQPLGDAGWEAYYRPLEARIASLREGASDDLRRVLDEGQAEADGWRAHKAETGYGLFVTQIRS